MIEAYYDKNKSIQNYRYPKDLMDGGYALTIAEYAAVHKERCGQIQKGESHAQLFLPNDSIEPRDDKHHQKSE